MKKNILWISLIFLIPLFAYFFLVNDKITTLPVSATGSDVVIKFASPMCYECQELEKSFKEIYPKYNKKISLNKIDVTKRDKNVEALISEYNVKLVPTTIFINQDGRIIRRVEGKMEPKVLDSYMVELINE